ncbi:MAG: hypothetical protein H6842_05055 [Rhodospirillaceae bacterium]|nr:hypothetical protein [Rhodospirillaceae bacterium]
MAGRRGFFRRMLSLPAVAGAGWLAAPKAGLAEGGGDDTGPLSLRDPRFGAVGDGQADDSHAFDAWIAAVHGQGREGHIPAGRYRVPNITPLSTDGPLVIRGAGRELAILDGEGLAPNNAIHLRHSADISGVTFARWQRIFVVSDGSAMDLSYHTFPEDFRWTEDIGEFRLTDCAFRGTTQPVYFWSGGSYFQPRFAEGSEPTIHRIVIRGNIVERAWGGFFLGVINLNDVWVEDNEFHDLDGTTAGYNDTGNAPLRGCVSQAVQIGRDRGLFERTTGRFYIRNNVFRNITDTRVSPNLGEFPEVQAINIVGASYFEIVGNYMENIYSDPPGVTPGTLDNCEGIYLKAVHGKIAHNDMINCGRGEATITIKGSPYDTRGQIKQTGAGSHIHIHNNTLIWNHPTWSREIGAIRLGGDNLIVTGNYIEGYGHPRSSYGPIYEPDLGVKNNIVIADNIIRDSRYLHAISLRCGGSGRTIRGNTIDGLDGAGQDSDEDTAAILVRARTPGVDAAHVLLVGNQVRGLTARPGKRSVGIRLWADEAEFHDVVVDGNLIQPGLDTGLHLRGRRFRRVTIVNNHLAGMAHAVDMGAEVDGMVAGGNHGWLAAPGRTGPFEIAGWGMTRLRLPLSGARPGDAVAWSASTGLAGILVDAKVLDDNEVSLTLFNATLEPVAVPEIDWSLRASRGI